MSQNKVRTAQCALKGGVKGQQEMVGFVLIVVIVVVAMMVFLVFSLRNQDDGPESVEVANMLSVMMDYTTDCSANSAIKMDTLEELFKSCYEDDRCSNLDNVEACEYLNETLKTVLEDVMASEATVTAYQLDFMESDEEGTRGILRIFEGNCTGEVRGAQQPIVSQSTDLIIGLKFCKKTAED